MMRAPLLVVAIASLVIAGCSRQPVVAPEPAVEPAPEASWTIVAQQDLSEAQQAQQQRAQEAIQAMGGRLMGELTAALDEGGPDGGIEVCSVRAPEISAAVANEYGLHIGRTSFRLRNRSNLPPAWAATLVEQQVSEPTWLAGPNGELGGLVPIRLKAECGMCHGPREQIDEEVLAKIDDYYPEDEATGFNDGDLRGWFWVEAPPG
jgi:hypothetical protein